MNCEFYSKWFFNFGDGMKEDDAIRVDLIIDAIDFTRQTMKVPPGCRHLRWDPCDEPCVVKNALFTTDDGRCLTPALVNGILVGEGYVFYHKDPQYILSFDDDVPTRSFHVTVSAEVHFIEDEYIARALQALDESRAHLKQAYEEQGAKKKKRRLLPSSAPGPSNVAGLDGNLLGDDHSTHEAMKILKQLMVPPEDNGLFVPYSQHDIQYKDGDVKPIAFYLPQFHAIPENDEWWGKGFTEWYNVASAVPSYYGHYQPHLPYDVGYYDLSHVDVMKRQVELAKNYGIYGFCLYYYRFGTKRLLEKPLDNFLEHKDELDIPFCVCWANENWSRRWDGQDKEVLMEQNYEADSLLCIQEIAGYFSDERYIHIGDKPLLIIYRGNLIPNVADMLDTWRRYLRDVGVGEVVIAGCAMNDVKDPVALGFDIGIDFTPNNFMTDIERQTLATSMSPTKREYHLYDMQQYLDEVDEFIKQNEEMFYTVFTSWDNTARRKSGAFIYPLSPEGYMYWLKKCIKATAENKSPDSRFVFINAWNEWAEGAHLEPDRRYGYAYLEATAEAFSEGL